MKGLCIRLSDEMISQLELEAKGMHLKKTQVARIYIENYLNLINEIEELKYQLREKEEEFKEYKEYVEDNYNKKSAYEIYGLNEEDFR